MNWTPAFVRKIIYLGIIVLLLFPLYWLGAPPTASTEDVNPKTPLLETFAGVGVLARMRRRDDLSQVDLGDVDPASETMKLSCFGMHGLAVNMLWSQAHEYKKRKDFDHMYVVLRQIAKLQPNFLSVWEFQSHNVSYNVSVDFDDYRQRYHWVRKGILFMLGGVRHNRRDTKMATTVGFYMGQKIGTADEKDQFRRLYRDDFKFHEAMVPYIDIHERPKDNWMASYQWYKKAEEMVQNEGVPIRGPGPVMFYRMKPMQFFNYGSALYREADPEEAENARLAWGEGNRLWTGDYGKMSLQTSYGVPVVLENGEQVEQRVEELRKELNALDPSVRERIEKEKLTKLTPAEREAYDTPADKRTNSQFELMFRVNPKLAIAPSEIAEAMPADQKTKARALAAQLEYEIQRAERIDHFRTVVNYKYWRQRSLSESEEDTKSARGHVYRANLHLEKAELTEAIKEYELAWKDWDVVLRRYPPLVEDITKDDLVEDINSYRRALEAAELEFPEDFILNYLLEARDPDHTHDHDHSDETTDTNGGESTKSSSEEEPPLP